MQIKQTNIKFPPFNQENQIFTCVVAECACITLCALGDIVITFSVTVGASWAWCWAARTFGAVVPNRACYAGGIH